MKIINIVGARPQFIKYFPVSAAIRQINSQKAVIEDILIHTGQHYDYNMSKIFFDELGIKEPDYHLGVGSGGHGEQTALILERIEKIYLKERPDRVIVYGDTNSTIGSALASVKLHIPVAHIEAGLRSFNKQMPEEINRVLTDHSSSVLLCPTEVAVKNLQAEGFRLILNDGKLVDNGFSCASFSMDPSNPLVVNVGDVMYDALLYSLKIAEKKSDILKKLAITSGTYCFLTIHRAENTDDPDRFRELIEVVNSASRGRTTLFPVHPRTRKTCEKYDIKFADNVRIIDPVGYFDLLALVKSSELVMTDSGGLQKEAYWLKVPCITLRQETEWVETLHSGWNVLYRDYRGIHQPSESEGHMYGDGTAAEKIINILAELSGPGGTL